jgi:signal transduction histidine kinase
MRRSGHKNAVPLDGKQTREATNTELIALIEHRLREPLGPTLLVLQLLLREESLSPQGIGLIRMLRRNIKEEVRAITDLLILMRTFLEDRSEERPDHKSDFWKRSLFVFGFSLLVTGEQIGIHPFHLFGYKPELFDAVRIKFFLLAERDRLQSDDCFPNFIHRLDCFL